MTQASRRCIRSVDSFNPQKVNRIGHDFSDHPLLQAEALRALAKRLEQGQTEKVKFIDPNAEAGSDFILGTRPPPGRSIDDLFDNLSAPGSWLAIYEARTDPEYGPLIDEVIAAGAPLLGAESRTIFDSDAYIFISAPPSLTPFHIDRENNFFLQIRGRKQFSAWDPNDRETVPESAVEGWIVRGSLAGVKWRDDHVRRAVVHEELGPGQGLFMPSTSAHMSRTRTRSESESGEPGLVSISIGVVYYTAHTKRHAVIYALNSLLRKLKWKPQPPGHCSRSVESIKYASGWVATRLLERMGRFYRQRGM
ncbi:MAG: hypothetical protein CBC48_06785 [bacterium TMED88]|nr:hypothetical protein [Deltaproteobacteria bacterium]OUV33348.1 MAG: hypothetical protein CBC48_06785 [bacterium TMED88]